MKSLGTWIGFSQDDARSIAEGGNIKRQSCGLSSDTLTSRGGDQSFSACITTLLYSLVARFVQDSDRSSESNRVPR